jgi:LPS export ABC transporter protein LptC
VTFYETDGKTLLADSPRAQMSEQTQTIVMMGGVHARTSDGGTLTCDRLTYDAKGELVHGRGHVIFIGAHGERATGSRIDANLRLSDVRMSAGGEDGP